MRTIAVDENNDFFLDHTGSIPVLTGKEAASQTSKHFAATVKGEMIHAVQKGVPFDLVLDKFPNLAQYEASLRRRILEVPTVVSITHLNIEYLGERVVYTATIRTEQGEVTIDG